jgi:hypothetical protein
MQEDSFGDFRRVLTSFLPEALYNALQEYTLFLQTMPSTLAPIAAGSKAKPTSAKPKPANKTPSAKAGAFENIAEPKSFTERQSAAMAALRHIEALLKLHRWLQQYHAAPSTQAGPAAQDLIEEARASLAWLKAQPIGEGEEDEEKAEDIGGDNA